MAEDLHIHQGSKKEQYQSLTPQIEALIAGETDLTANLGNICAALKEQFKWFWVGFYLIKNDELVLNAPGASCLYTDKKRFWRMWHCVAKSSNCNS